MYTLLVHALLCRCAAAADRLVILLCNSYSTTTDGIVVYTTADSIYYAPQCIASGVFAIPVGFGCTHDTVCVYKNCIAVL
jgi:hypothetical protein